MGTFSQVNRPLPATIWTQTFYISVFLKASLLYETKRQVGKMIYDTIADNINLSLCGTGAMVARPDTIWENEVRFLTSAPKMKGENNG